MSTLENSSVRWAIAFVFLGVELLLFVVVADLFWVDRLIAVVVSMVLFATIPATLKAVSETGTAPVESTQQRRTALVAGAVGRVAAVMRIDRIAPLVSWIGAVFLVVLAGGTMTEHLSGTSIRTVASASVYLLLAAFATPPVRSRLQERLRVTFSRPVVVVVLTAGVLVNEEVVAPPM